MASWLPDGALKPCTHHPNSMLTKPHAITCLHMHRRLQMPHTIADPLYFLLNKLHHRKKASTEQNRLRYSAWSVQWSTLCQLLFELDHLHHGKIPPETPPLGSKLITWLCNN
ncbi:hypothetical protein G6F62_009736 [Rhizopus arrhizus]|uniref:Uncharacterized protein n=1 Tax=Rhizopus oryzae TaxID=64495 RepID=A0A9P6XCS0_RHIOR|nr:hypothetical protein G6F23_010187 [Rhizopus arrhizus]KAG0765553.1 hypothetical protein G6F24_004327 [Rhizopus arrhizus]KAG0782939.1 hypothetical protein G6F22_008894 [Rhizopus arrhizus]KAG0792304.1 hypothetical protein G6F21_004450 [Rhizopus arrhizus]KAG0815611.1 hypothetical protein G6F20_003856 [Rhizopus arrhizus]